MAADWAVRWDLGSLTSHEEAAFRAWLAADIRHLGAYGRAEAVLARLETDVQYLRIYVRTLRRKLEADPEQPGLILTEQGVGYRLRAAD